jgi:cycloeucalenol cycloisomerase
MYLGIAVGIPCMILPIVMHQQDIEWTRRYSTKATLWIWILSFIANYDWTHYFYNVLGAKYTFNAHRLNDVPFCLYLMTHSYFALYHCLASIVFRVFGFTQPNFKSGKFVGLLVVMSYFVAFMETWTIQKFPYYAFENEQAMYKYGLVFYALYFIVSFPMFLRLEEPVRQAKGNLTIRTKSLSEVALDAFACSMMITLLLDFWRLWVGRIY